MTFDPFSDFSTSGYLRNALGLKDADEVKKAEHLAFESSVEDALHFLALQPAITYSTFLSVHKILFSDFYPWAGKDRNELVPHLAVFKGMPEDAHFTMFEQPHSIQLAVDYALRLASDSSRFRKKPGEVMGQLAFAHPFLDGNGRTLLLLFMEMTYRAGFAIEWARTKKDAYLSALSAEIREPAKGHLDNYLLPCVVDIASRSEWPAMISGIKGLDGLDKEDIYYGAVDDPDIKALYQSYTSSSRLPHPPAESE